MVLPKINRMSVRTYYVMKVFITIEAIKFVYDLTSKQ